MSFFGKLFGSSKASAELVEATKSGLDYMFHTDQEKSEERMEMDKFAGNMFIEWQKNTQGQNLSRRILALSIAGTWLMQYWGSALVGMRASWFDPVDDKAHIEQLERLQASIGQNADAMTGAMMLLLGFYFAAPHLGKIVDGAMQKFGEVKIGKAISTKNNQ